MGKLIAVEGPDKVGKSTLLQHLSLQFQERGYGVKFFRFPPDERSREVDLLFEVFTKTDDPVKRQLTLVQMYNAYGPRILGALRENDLVLIDRYMLSVLIACKALGQDIKPINEALRSAIIPPDITIIYTGEPFQGRSDESTEEREFHEKVHELFDEPVPEYRHSVVQVTNEAARHGKFTPFITHLADQILGQLRLPLHKDPTATAR